MHPEEFNIDGMTSEKIEAFLKDAIFAETVRGSEDEAIEAGFVEIDGLTGVDTSAQSGALFGVEAQKRDKLSVRLDAASASVSRLAIGTLNELLIVGGIEAPAQMAFVVLRESMRGRKLDRAMALA